MNTFRLIADEMRALADKNQVEHLARFFKTGPGEYGEGDRFIGIRVPATRSVVKKYRKRVDFDDVAELINSEWHEMRLAGFLLLVELYRDAIKNDDWAKAKLTVDFYIARIDRGNNWDLVDLVAEYILGEWILLHRTYEKLLMEFAGMDGCLWHQRVAIVSTFALIRAGKFEVTFIIAEKFLDHTHDLIHKATGWMLREVGKRGGRHELVKFLNKYKSKMPRTMLRYAIEKFPEAERKEFMKR